MINRMGSQEGVDIHVIRNEGRKRELRDRATDKAEKRGNRRKKNGF